MSYYIGKTLNTDFNTAIERVKTSLLNEGFGVLTEINMSGTLKKKLGVDFRKYTILGACNPSLAYKAVQSERNIGTMLPCNVVVQEIEEKNIEVAAVDPYASMQAIDNDALKEIAQIVRGKLATVIENLK